MRRTIIALPAILLLAGTYGAYAAEMAPSKERTTEGRAAQTTPSSSDKPQDRGGTMPDGPSASGPKVDSSSKGQGN